MNCPSPRCGSSNIQLLSHYRESLPPGSPLRDAYAEPTAAKGSVLAAVGLVVLGIFMLLSGGILAGLAAIVGGVLWGAGIHKRAEVADKARTVWANRRISLACTEHWTP